jgi:hypothetical protein
MPTRDDAIHVLQDQAALTPEEAATVVDAVAAVAAEDVFLEIAGEEPVTGTATERRAMRVARISDQLGRLLSQREVEVLLRVPGSTARSTLARVRAGWPAKVDGWIAAQIVSHLDRIEDASTQAEGKRWRIIFNDDAALSYAAERLRREGMTRDLLPTVTKQELLVPKQMRDRRGQLRDPRKVLGLA